MPSVYAHARGPTRTLLLALLLAQGAFAQPTRFSRFPMPVFPEPLLETPLPEWSEFDLSGLGDSAWAEIAALHVELLAVREASAREQAMHSIIRLSMAYGDRIDFRGATAPLAIIFAADTCQTHRRLALVALLQVADPAVVDRLIRLLHTPARPDQVSYSRAAPSLLLIHPGS